ncbi:MAG: gliding motility-associated C-terminal domain-containing protein, partial [Flavobacteriales bacterium]
DSISKLIEVKERTSMYVPSAFTPNNDGDNDEFRPIFNSIDARKYNLQIFNRWGELLFETTDYSDAWDGTFQGQKVPQGTYIWKVSYKEENGFGVFSETGHVNVLW